MSLAPRQSHLQVFSTCPQSNEVPAGAYLERVLDVARWSEDVGFAGSLIYTDNSLVDPWMVAQVVLENTSRLCPLVAVQPLYLHPYMCAKKVATLGYLYGRRVCLNMVAGGFLRDLAALDDHTDHDRRYDRLVEYTTIVNALLASTAPVTFSGAFYSVRDLKLAPSLPESLRPGVMLSGSSEAGLAAARRLGATAVQYPKPVNEYEGSPMQHPVSPGIRIGIIARPDAEEAWRAAWARFPGDRKGQLTHQLAMKTSDLVWHRQLSQLADEFRAGPSPYWLHPFEQYRTFCPYLVGSYEQVTGVVARYVRLGFTTFILDIPESRAELDHIATIFAAVEDGVTA